MTSEDIVHLKALLQQMRVSDPDFRVFGAEGHEYRLMTPLSEDELAAFERKHRITLPEDYRFFLKYAGDGGAGMGYGVRSLEKAVEHCSLSRPFPLTAPLESSPYPEGRRWRARRSYPGVLEICHHGCGYYTYLVVNGPACGTVWEADYDYYVLIPTGLTFEGWYRRWIDGLIERSLPMIVRERVVKQVKVGMTASEVIDICGGVGGKWERVEKDFVVQKFLFLRFERLATQFELDSNDVVVRSVPHSVPSYYHWESYDPGRKKA